MKISDLNHDELIPLSAGTYHLIYGFRRLASLGAANLNRGVIKIGLTSVEVTAEQAGRVTAGDLMSQGELRLSQQDSGTTDEMRFLYLAVDSKLKPLRRKKRLFADWDVHDFLSQSGFSRERFEGSKSREWFLVDDETACRSIEAAMRGDSVSAVSHVQPGQELTLFPYQESAVETGLRLWARGQETGEPVKMLCSFKPRAGKTITAYAIAKALQLRRVLVITHRPQVVSGWAQDINMVLDGYQFGAKNDIYGAARMSFEELDLSKPFVYFLSTQDGRGKDASGGDVAQFKQSNKAIIDFEYDAVIIDEAHEGDSTELATQLHNAVSRKMTLKLSGTPFRMLNSNEFEPDEIVEWQYTDEREAFLNWHLTHPGTPNPWALSPSMEMHTIAPESIPDDGAFTFKQMFEMEEVEGELTAAERAAGLKHRFTPAAQQHLRKFLNVISNSDDPGEFTEMPFSDSMWAQNRHSLWVVPSVAVAKALKIMLASHNVFSNYQVMNVAGGDMDYGRYPSAVDLVNGTIGENPALTKTITLTVGRLTVGVTVPGWSAVLMLNDWTSPESYIQTIFRVQSVCKTFTQLPDGTYDHKRVGRVYDFAPDRALNMVSAVSRVTDKDGYDLDVSLPAQETLREFLNFFPVIANDGVRMEAFSVEGMMTTIKQVLGTQVAEQGFASPRLFQTKLLAELSAQDMQKMREWGTSVNTRSQSTEPGGKVTIADKGLQKPEFSENETQVKKAPKAPTQSKGDAEKERQRAEREVLTVLNTIVTRIPLMILGTETVYTSSSTTFNLESFIDEFDAVSWKEFMQSLTKDQFKEALKWINTATLSAAVHEWLQMVEHTNETDPARRVEAKSALLQKIRNPDKETVITPPNVARKTVEEAGVDWEESFILDRSFYDIHSKSGIYPVEMTERLYVHSELNGEEGWQHIVSQFIYANSATQAGRYITMRMLNVDRDSPAANNFTSFDLPLLQGRLAAWNKLKKAERNALKKVDVPSFSALLLALGNVGYIRNKFGASSVRLYQSIRCKNMLDAILEQLDTTEPLTTHSVTKMNEVIGMVEEFSDEEKAELRFDYVISNPPYQRNLNTGGAGNKTLATQMYPMFVMVALSLGRCGSFITPGRWFNNPKQKHFRRDLMALNFDKRVESLHYITNSSTLFPQTDFPGGLSIYSWEEEEKESRQVAFRTDSGEIVERPLFTKVYDGWMVLPDNDIANFLDKLELGEDQGSELYNLYSGVSKAVTLKLGDASSSTLRENTSSERSEDFPVRMSVTNEVVKSIRTAQGWRFLPEGILNKDCLTPSIALCFANASNESRTTGSINDNTILLEKGESGKSIQAYFTNVEKSREEQLLEAYRFYAYARTRFFAYCMRTRLSSHNTMATAYRHVPKFKYDDTDPIDWDAPIDEIDTQLFAHFGMDDSLREYAREVAGKPFAARLKPEFVKVFEDAGIQVDESFKMVPTAGEGL